MISHSKPWICNEDIKAVANVLDSGMIANGSQVPEFEKMVADYIKVRKCFATQSCSSAIFLALKALDIKGNDEVILPTYVCHSVQDAILNTGANPVLCDIGQDWNMTYETVSRRVNSRTKAIIVVHMFGIPADVERLKEFNIPLIEDCAQALGAEISTQKCGSFGDIGVFSFNATKCATTGEGGMVATSKPSLMKKMNDLTMNVYRYKMPDMLASLGISQMKRYHEFLMIRRKISQKYMDALAIPRINGSMYFRFPLKVDGVFEDIKNLFIKRGIHVRKGVDELIHRRNAMDDSGFSNAIHLFEKTISIPIYPALTDSEADHVAETLNMVKNIVI